MQMPIESLNLQMLNVGFARHEADWNWKGVNSPFTRIYCVTEGEAWLHIEEAPHPSVRLRPGHLYMIPAYTRHSYECKGVFAHYYLHVYEGFKKETDVFERFVFPSEVMAREGDEMLMRGMCERHPEAKLPESDPRSYDTSRGLTDYVKRYHELPLHEKMALRGATLMLFSRFMEQARGKVWTRDERLTKVVKFIHNNIYDNMEVDGLADVACVSKPYLIRLFKRDFGMSPLQYVNHKKVEKAELLLLTEDMPVKEVAYTLGFSDHSYFIRLFKKMTGRTPQEYRMMFN